MAESGTDETINNRKEAPNAYSLSSIYTNDEDDESASNNNRPTTASLDMEASHLLPSGTNVDNSAKTDPPVNQHIGGSTLLSTLYSINVSPQRPHAPQAETDSEYKTVSLDMQAIDGGGRPTSAMTEDSDMKDNIFSGIGVMAEMTNEDESGYGRELPSMPSIMSRDTNEVAHGHPQGDLSGISQAPVIYNAPAVTEDRPPRRLRRPSEKRVAQLALAQAAPTSNLNSVLTTSKPSSLSRSVLVPFGNESTASSNIINHMSTRSSQRMAQTLPKKAPQQKEHVAVNETHTYACSVCPKRFPVHQSLRDHMNTHAGIKRASQFSFMISWL